MELEPKYVSMINQLRMVNSDEDVGNFLKAVMMHDLAKAHHLSDAVLMPKELSAENGSKGLMSGEFFESVEVNNPDYCGCNECDFCNDFKDTEETITIKAPVTWSTIKEIYKKLVEYHAPNQLKK